MAARRLHNLIYATIANCCLFVVVCAVALGTNKWFSSSTKGEVAADGEIKVTVSYGLFIGEKTKTSPSSSTNYNLKVVCQSSKCMYSCAKSAEKRKQDITDLLAGNVEADYTICADEDVGNSGFSNASYNERAPRADTGNERIFMNFGLYLATIACIGLAMIFAVLGGGLALYNTYRTPIQPILSVLGLYLSNAIAGAFVVLSMIMWGTEFATRLKKNAAISDTISGTHDSSGRGTLGVSFWILILAICFAFANIVILRYRTWKIMKMEEKNIRVMTDKLESGDILLF